MSHVSGAKFLLQAAINLSNTDIMSGCFVDTVIYLQPNCILCRNVQLGVYGALQSVTEYIKQRKMAFELPLLKQNGFNGERLLNSHMVVSQESSEHKKKTAC